MPLLVKSSSVVEGHGSRPEFQDSSPQCIHGSKLDAVQEGLESVLEMQGAQVASAGECTSDQSGWSTWC
jgi:hypothetical protein